MGKVTYVVEYEDGMEPHVYSDMEVAGGKLADAMWSDYRDYRLSPEELDIIDVSLTELSHNRVSVDTYVKIMSKLSLMTQSQCEHQIEAMKDIQPQHELVCGEVRRNT